MLAALAVLLNKRLEAKSIRKKNSFEQDNISWAGIRKYQICVHDCFLVKKREDISWASWIRLVLMMIMVVPGGCAYLLMRSTSFSLEK